MGNANPRTHPTSPPIKVNTRTGLLPGPSAASIAWSNVGAYTDTSPIAASCGTARSVAAAAAAFAAASKMPRTWTFIGLRAQISTSNFRLGHFFCLGHRNPREVFYEEGEQQKKPCKAAGCDPPLHPGRTVRPNPPCRVEAVRQRAHDDDETLEPHADIHENRDDEQGAQVRPHLFPEERQRHQAVANDHCPE